MKRIFWGFLLLVSLVVSGCGAGGTVNDPAAGTGGTGTGTGTGTDTGTDTGTGTGTDTGTGTGTGTGTTPPGTGNATLGASLGALTDIGDYNKNNFNTGFEYYYTAVAGINAANEIIGYTSTGPMPFVQNPITKIMQPVPGHGGTYDDYYNLKTTPSENFFEATRLLKINDQSRIIGNTYRYSAVENTRGYIYDANTSTFTDLAPINYLDTTGKRKFKEYSNVVDINAAGWVLLTADDAKGVKKAYLWDGVTMETVGDLLRENDAPVAPFDVPAFISAGSIENNPTFAVAINDNPTLSGFYQFVCNSGDSAFVYDGFNITTLNQFNGKPLVAVDMNNKLPVGHVVGNSGDDGFFWAGGVIYPIKNPSGASVTVVDINNNDIVVGNSGGQAFVWHLDPATKTGVFEAIGSLGGGTSTAVAINDNGIVIGKSATGASVTAGGINYAVEHGFAWRNKVIYDLGTHVPTYLYPLIPDYPFSEAVAITESNTIVGNSYSINAHKRGFIISPTIP